MIKTIEDKYDGVTVDEATIPETKGDFKREMVGLIKSLGDKKLLWAGLPVEKADFISVLTGLGFEFHHCQEKRVTLVKKLAQDAFVPTTKNYIVGVGAIVVREGQLLVVKDRLYVGYKLPGGHIEKGESIQEALKREVFEEMGVAIDLESIMGIGHFRQGQFGETNLYLVCTAKAVSLDININDSSEIIEARWMEVEAFLASEEVNPFNKSVVRAAVTNQELKLTAQPVKLRVPGSEVFF